MVRPLILLDLFLNGATGFDALEKIKAGGKCVNSPIIFVTRESTRSSVASAIKYGACDFVVKPFDTGMFLHKVGRWINAGVEEGWKKLKPREERLLRLTLATVDKAFEMMKTPPGHFDQELMNEFREMMEKGI